jgi:inosine/xanthosine triphosphatase
MDTSGVGRPMSCPEALVSVTRVRVGSLNAPKIGAVRGAFAAFGSEPECRGVEVESGVPEQPVGFDEIVAGARNRAAAAYASGPCDLAVGIEDGLIEVAAMGPGSLNIGCAVVTDGSHDSPALSSAFPYPPECAQPALADREPIGALFDRLWRERRGGEATDPASQSGDSLERAGLPSSMTVGNIGRLSLRVLNRSEYAKQSVICALLRFIHPDLYFDRAVRSGQGGPGDRS